jgi:murein L,D-transpeptidase YcbB/YkuD
LLRGNIDLEELKKGKKDTEPSILKLPENVPVFIIYSTVKVTGNKIIFLPDVYNLVK